MLEVLLLAGRDGTAVGIKSQDKLAQMLDCDRSVLAKAETGERLPS